MRGRFGFCVSGALRRLRPKALLTALELWEKGTGCAGGRVRGLRDAASWALGGRIWEVSRGPSLLSGELTIFAIAGDFVEFC